MWILASLALGYRARGVGRGLAGVVCAVLSAAAFANQPPNTPSVNEPIPPGLGTVDPRDVHMETFPFSDPDMPNDSHLDSDWEIFDTALNEVVWRAFNITGGGRVHVHFGDGVFVNSLAGATTLVSNTPYQIRVRHRDASGQPNAASAWASRSFQTGSVEQTFPFALGDVLGTPAPSLRSASGSTLGLPTGATPARVRLENVNGQVLVDFVGTGTGTSVLNPAGLSQSSAVRAVVRAGTQALSVPAMDVMIGTDRGVKTVFLPAVNLPANQEVVCWIASNGASYYALAGQTVPDFSILARGNPLPWDTTPDFRISRFAEGFTLPVTIAFANNPGPNPNDVFFYVTELYGTIKVVTRNGTVSNYATGLINFDPFGDFPGSGERGLAGLCVDPTNGDLFATTAFVGATDEINGKVIKLVSTDGGRTASSVTTILAMTPGYVGPSHQISNITFGPDGNLYVHIGDGFEAIWGDLDDWRAKIHRITRTGAPVPTNPFYNVSNGITPRDYTYTWGMRNPFGGAWRISDGVHYVVENGPSIDRITKLVAGRNYGYDGTNEAMYNFAAYNWDPAVGPVNIAFLQQASYGRSGFPAEYEGLAYVTQSGPTYAGGPSDGRWKAITEWNLSTGNALIEGPRTIARYSGPGRSTAIPLAAGPDGLYFGDFYPEEPSQGPVGSNTAIFRLAYTPPADCDGNMTSDYTQMNANAGLDCNNNRVLDSCEVGGGSVGDCDMNGQPDSCQATQALTQNFSSVPGPPFRFRDAGEMVGNGYVSFSDCNGICGMTFDPPFAGPVQTLRVQYDVALLDPGTAYGMCMAIMNADIHGPVTLFEENGPGVGSVCVMLDPRDETGRTDRLRVSVDGNTVLDHQLTYNVDDAVFRTVQVTLVNDRITVRLQNNNGAMRDIFINERLLGYTPFRARLGWGSGPEPSGTIHRVDNVSVWVPNANDLNMDGLLDGFTCPTQGNSCDAIDFNGDGVSPDSLDIEDFIAVFGGGPCSNDPPMGTGCGDIDFNNDGVSPDSADIEAFLRVFGGGEC